MEELKRSEVGDHLLHVSVTSSRQSDSTTMRSLVPAGINQTPSHNASASAISADNDALSLHGIGSFSQVQARAQPLSHEGANPPNLHARSVELGCFCRPRLARSLLSREKAEET